MVEKQKTVAELLAHIKDEYAPKRKNFAINDRVFDGIGDTALHYYSGWGDAEAVELLLTAGADVNVVGEDNMTPIYAAIRVYAPNIVEKLIKAGADLKHKDDLFGYTPLYTAELNMATVSPKEKPNLEKIIKLLKENQ